MKVPTPLLQWTKYLLLLSPLLSTGTCIEVREPENETDMTATATVVTPDNGVAVGEGPSAAASGTLGTPLFQVTGSEAEFSTSKPIVDAVFPENHKPNFNASPYAGTIETPPLLNNFNKYQHAYKEYYTQKNEFINAKPIKFEDNYSQNKYVTAGNGLSAYGDETQLENEVVLRHKPLGETQAGSDIHLRNRPFPYAYSGLHDEVKTTTDLDDGFDSGVGDTIHDTESSGFNLFSSPLANLFPYTGGQLHKPKTDVSESGKHQHGSWKKTLRFLSTVIPFGIFLATLTPNILQINTAEDTRPSRLRSLDEARKNGDPDDPLVQLVARFGGLEAMDDPVCEDRFFCEMSRLGSNESSNFVERGFWFLANETPDDMAQEAGMKELFTAIRTNSCHVYDCQQSKSRQSPESRQDNNIDSAIVDREKPQISPEKKESKPRKTKKFFRS